MDKNQKKTEDRNIDRATITQRPIKDRGDLSKSLLIKVFEELDIMDILQDRDRGYSRAPIRQFRNYKTVKSPKHKARKATVINKTDEVAARILSAARNEILNVLDFEPNDVTRKENSIKLEMKNLDEKAKKATSKDIKSGTDEIEERKANQVKIDDVKKKFDDVTKTKKNPSTLPRATDKLDSQNKTVLDLETRRRIRQKYTVKLKNYQIQRNVDNIKGNLINDDCDTNKKQREDNTDNSKPHDSSKSFSQTEPTKTTKWSKEPTQVQKKPIVRTVRLSNDNRVYKDYKTVTFLEEKESTPLQIKIPNNCKKDLNSAETNTVVSSLKAAGSHVSIQMPQVKKRRVLKKKSPILVSKHGSPLTEVAKWAPSCISQQTKPYYEAWVDTTLTSISKCSEEEKLRLKKQNILKTFKRVLELHSGERSPDIVCEKLNDSRYTGKITVRRSKAK